MKIERLLTMTILLLNRRKVTAKELAEQFNITVRTVYRDIETLNASGIPVISYQGYEGGFCIADNFKMSRQLLTFDDITSLLSLLKGVNQTLHNRDVASVIEKITALIPSEREAEYQTHSNSFMIDITPWGRGAHIEELITDMHSAVSESRKVTFDYTTANGNSSIRSVEPHTMVMKSFSWYLLGYCELREQFRLFKLVRMQNISISETRFVRREIDPQKFFSNGSDTRPLMDVVLKFDSSMRYKIEEDFDSSQYKINEDASLTVSFPIQEDEWVTSMILSYGANVTVLSPARLQKRVAQEIQKMQTLYSQ